ncbi:hypothetical protein BH10CYA1_BH10CYA1_39590 [soil metagenome]
MCDEESNLTESVKVAYNADLNIRNVLSILRTLVISMKTNIWNRIALTILTVLCFPNAAWSHADVFSDIPFAQAKEQAQKDGKFFLIDFTASWCPPCKTMEASTWTNSEVQSWIKENAIAIQIDVDHDTKIKSALEIAAMPTMVLFSPKNTAAEFGRQVGYMDPSDLLRWLEGAKSGKTAQDLDKEHDAGNAVFDHFGKARELQSAGKNAEAVEEYIWIWNNASSTDPNVAPIRMSAVPVELKKLLAVYPAGKTKFSELRDTADKASNRQDWIILNTVLDDDARTLTWFDKVKIDPKQSDIVQKQSALLETILFNKFKWNDAATYLYPNPLVKVNDYFKRAQDMKKPRPDTEVSTDFDPFPSMVLLLYGAYVGAGKDVEAQKIASECLRLDDTAAMREGLKNMETGMRSARGVQHKTTK